MLLESVSLNKWPTFSSSRIWSILPTESLFTSTNKSLFNQVGPEVTEIWKYIPLFHTVRASECDWTCSWCDAKSNRKFEQPGEFKCMAFVKKENSFTLSQFHWILTRLAGTYRGCRGARQGLTLGRAAAHSRGHAHNSLTHWIHLTHIFGFWEKPEATTRRRCKLYTHTQDQTLDSNPNPGGVRQKRKL